mmetsp:Transcript_37743/g.55424  ORF Transcript_37743/g.55424 Transcript_37743/m.55424 type:complete len:208 (-) Transcript_37743:46-669(-)
MLIRDSSKGAEFVEVGVRFIDHFLSSHWIVFLASCGAPLFRNCVSAIEGIHHRPPTGIGSVQNKSGIVDRTHQLRPRNGGDLGIHVGGFHLEGRALSHQVADVREKLFVFGHFDWLAGCVILVDLELHGIPLVEQCLVSWRVFENDFAKCAPEVLGIDASAWGNVLLHHFDKARVNLETTLVYHDGHKAQPHAAMARPELARRQHAE